MKQVFVLVLCSVLCACSRASVATPTLPAQWDADVQMESAFQQARDTLDLFIQKIETPHPNRSIVAVKVRFLPPDAASQDIWVDEVTYVNGVFHGSMGDDIPSLKLRFGEKITVAKEDVLDWMIVEDGKLIGGYTIRLALKRMAPDEKQRFLESLDYTIDP